MRKQSKEIALKLRARVQTEKENQLRKFGKIKEKELQEWKQRQASELQRFYDICSDDYGSAHQAAKEEENNLLAFQEERETFDLIAADRGRNAISKELEKRKREEEAKALRKKKYKQKTIGVQTEKGEKFHRLERRIELPVASTSTRKPVVLEDCSDQDSDNSINNKDNESDVEIIQLPVTKNFPKPTTTAPKVTYNPLHFTTHSTDSSLNTPEDSSIEFHQITNILKRQQCWDFDKSPEKPPKTEKPPQKSPEFVQADVFSESEEEEAIHIRSPLKLKKTLPLKKKTISLKPPPRTPHRFLKKAETRKPEVAPKVKSVGTDPKKFVKYVDFSNQYSKEYQQPADLVIQHRRPTVPSDHLNAMEEARSLNREKVNREYNHELLK